MLLECLNTLCSNTIQQVHLKHSKKQSNCRPSQSALTNLYILIVSISLALNSFVPYISSHWVSNLTNFSLSHISAMYAFVSCTQAYKIQRKRRENRRRAGSAPCWFAYAAMPDTTILPHHQPPTTLKLFLTLQVRERRGEEKYLVCMEFGLGMEG